MVNFTVLFDMLLTAGLLGNQFNRALPDFAGELGTSKLSNQSFSTVGFCDNISLVFLEGI